MQKSSLNYTKQIIRDFRLDDVRVLDTYSVNAMEKEMDYLLSLEPDKLLSGFYEIKGMKGKQPKYSGWESTEIKGHTLGHYLVAISQAYMVTKSKEMLRRIEYIASELKQCQLENGYLFASEQEIFDRVEQRKPAWVPWYTMHKILSGLIAAYHATKNEEVLQVASGLGDWIYQRTSKWSDELKKIVLSVEYGGMNDVLYELYKITGNSRYLDAAHDFDELPLFEAMKNKQDILDGRHANTTIPKILGALNRYITLCKDEEFYLAAAENFWDIVTEHHTYITGGNSEWEHFGKPDILDAERTNCNCETCNTYNMLKLSKLLFQATGNKKYVDYYENTLINAILASQNPDTGMTLYFQPMATGYFKVFGTPYDKFWCCTGTGMENFTKLNDGIYMHTDERLYVNRYISSEATWEEKEILLEQIADIPNTKTVEFFIHSLNKNKQLEFELALRIPDWLSDDIIVFLNHEKINFTIQSGFVVIDRVWNDADSISMELPFKVRYTALPDNLHSIAFSYGPVVLCAGLGKKDMRIIQTGVAVDIPTKEMKVKDFLIVKECSADEWLQKIEEHFIKRDGKLEFELRGTDEDERLVFSPYYCQHGEKYGIYWGIVGATSKELQAHILQEKDRGRFEKSIIDKIPIGNDQYELVHDIRGENTVTGGIEGHHSRILQNSSWVSYRINMIPAAEYYLGITYSKNDIGKTLDIYIDNQLFTSDTIQDTSNRSFFDVEYPLPKHLLDGKQSIEIKFAHKDIDTACNIFDFLYLRKGYEDNTFLRSVQVNGIELREDSFRYSIPCISKEEPIVLQLTPDNPNSLVYVDGILIDDSQIQQIAGKDNNVIEVIIEAENRQIKQKYEICF